MATSLSAQRSDRQGCHGAGRINGPPTGCYQWMQAAGPGLPIEPTGPAQPRPALAVVFDNDTSEALPQVGLNEADVVLEVIVEGQTTRPTGIYNSRDVDHVGPIVTDYQPSTADVNSPQASSVGNGSAVVYRDATRIDGTWSRASRTDPFLLADAGRPARRRLWAPPPMPWPPTSTVSSRSVT